MTHLQSDWPRRKIIHDNNVKDCKVSELLKILNALCTDSYSGPFMVDIVTQIMFISVRL